MNFSTGDFYQDIQTKNLLNQFFDVGQACFYQPFDESNLFRSEGKHKIKDEVKNFFYNISQLMNCVECEKCKTYGKMQVQGLGTALK